MYYINYCDLSLPKRNSGKPSEIKAFSPFFFLIRVQLLFVVINQCTSEIIIIIIKVSA